MKLASLNRVLSLDEDHDLHLARILILLSSMARNEGTKKVSGITKLAKLDFLLRYPTALERALMRIGIDPSLVNTAPRERNSVESRMVRYKYGPWDYRYWKYLSLLRSRGLITVELSNNTVFIEITEKGMETSKGLAYSPEFSDYVERSEVIHTHFGTTGATTLKNLMYELYPELKSMKYGEYIKP